MNIAVILTCFNRKAKTLKCLESLFAARDAYATGHPDEALSLSIYLTDDGCTDGTADAVRQLLTGKDLHIIQGNGTLYWAGGMRAAWREALKVGGWDYYLLLNDDTVVVKDAFVELVNTQCYCLNEYKRKGIYSGITCDTNDGSIITYGGDVWVDRLKATARRLPPSSAPQLCDMTNANILLVPAEVVEEIGIFHDGYRHGIADYDYSIQARGHGIPVLITANVCGACDNDHDSDAETREKICAMSFGERRKYFKNPLHSNKDYLTFIKRCAPKRYGMVCLGRFLNSYLPKLYYWLDDKMRGK